MTPFKAEYAMVDVVKVRVDAFNRGHLFRFVLRHVDVEVEMSDKSLNLLDVVALTDDMPDDGLVRGQVGTIVEKLAADVFEVEFCDDDGRTYAMLPVQASQLIRLVYQPVEAA